MIKAIIVDDEEKGGMALNNLLKKNCANVEVIEICDSVENAVVVINKHNPDLIFLDIEMPFKNGFALFENFKTPSFEVIFTTAYDHYAIKAIKYSAMDYLLKPVDTDELIVAVSKVELKSQLSAPHRLELLLSNLKLKGNVAKLAIPTLEGLQMIHSADIIKCTARESYTEIVLISGKKLLVSRILKEYEDLLSDLNFLRVHNSYLVNLSHVVKYVKGDGGHLIMTDGGTVEVSRRKKNELLNRLALFLI